MTNFDYEKKLIIISEDSNLIDAYIDEKELRRSTPEARCFEAAISCEGFTLGPEYFTRVHVAKGWDVVYRRAINHFKDNL